MQTCIAPNHLCAATKGCSFHWYGIISMNGKYVRACVPCGVHYMANGAKEIYRGNATYRGEHKWTKASL